MVTRTFSENFKNKLLFVESLHFLKYAKMATESFGTMLYSIFIILHLMFSFIIRINRLELMGLDISGLIILMHLADILVSGRGREEAFNRMSGVAISHEWAFNILTI